MTTIQNDDRECWLRCGFSHNYSKLHNQTRARLIEAVAIDRNSIHPEAIAYDTVYTEQDGSTGFFELKEGVYLRLLFMGELGIPFTTYRPYTPDMRKKYANNVGEWFYVYVHRH